jgi:hypothetical protein
VGRLILKKEPLKRVPDGQAGRLTCAVAILVVTTAAAVARATETGPG